ncbi:hypothetical protein T492DRAFT_1145265 [Pavlovales sp. CCMP2436]|nr:hypothetical protein T492DRAFT_1145265 [Pavlovales sp. CCMP2436]
MALTQRTQSPALYAVLQGDTLAAVLAQLSSLRDFAAAPRVCATWRAACASPQLARAALDAAAARLFPALELAAAEALELNVTPAFSAAHNDFTGVHAEESPRARPVRPGSHRPGSRDPPRALRLSARALETLGGALALAARHLIFEHAALAAATFAIRRDDSPRLAALCVAASRLASPDEPVSAENAFIRAGARLTRRVTHWGTHSRVASAQSNALEHALVVGALLDLNLKPGTPFKNISWAQLAPDFARVAQYCERAAAAFPR